MNRWHDNEKSICCNIFQFIPSLYDTNFIAMKYEMRNVFEEISQGATNKYPRWCEPDFNIFHKKWFENKVYRCEVSVIK